MFLFKFLFVIFIVCMIIIFKKSINVLSIFCIDWLLFFLYNIYEENLVFFWDYFFNGRFFLEKNYKIINFDKKNFYVCKYWICYMNMFEIYLVGFIWYLIILNNLCFFIYSEIYDDVEWVKEYIEICVFVM